MVVTYDKIKKIYIKFRLGDTVLEAYQNIYISEFLKSYEDVCNSFEIN